MAESPEGPQFDREDQLKQIQGGLLADEKLYGVYDAKGAGTGFIGLTNQRVIIQDKSFVGKKIALVSLPYSRIASVAVLTNASFTGNFFSSGALYIISTAGTHHEIDFRGTDRARHVHDL